MERNLQEDFYLLKGFVLGIITKASDIPEPIQNILGIQPKKEKEEDV